MKAFIISERGIFRLVRHLTVFSVVFVKKTSEFNVLHRTVRGSDLCSFGMKRVDAWENQDWLIVFFLFLRNF